MVRKQPVQIRSVGCTTQMRMQGLSASLRFQTMSDIGQSPLEIAQAIQRPLQDIGRCDVVDHL